MGAARSRSRGPSKATFGDRSVIVFNPQAYASAASIPAGFSLNRSSRAATARFWSARRQRDNFLPRWHLYTLEPNLTDINSVLDGCVSGSCNAISSDLCGNRARQAVASEWLMDQ